MCGLSALVTTGRTSALYDRYAESIYRFCYHRLWDRHQAEDATSTTFVRAMTSLASYRDGSFRGWLFGIAHHVTIDLLRARRPTELLSVAVDVASNDPLPDD